MAHLDIFRNQAFESMELSDAITVVPNQYGRLQEMNLFPADPRRTTRFSVERDNKVLNLVPTAPRGGPATPNDIGKRDLRDFSIPHVPLEDSISADDVQNVRAFGSETELMAVADLVNDKLMTMAQKLDITLEYQRWGALKGQVLDADGSLLLDLFTSFGVTQKVINFDLSTQTTKIDPSVFELKRYEQQNAFGAVYNGIHVMCSPGFYENLYTHDDVRLSYNRAQGPTNQFGEDYRNGFIYNGIRWEEYLGEATSPDGQTVTKFIPDDEAIAFPIGSVGVFSTKFAPADFMETVNTRALPRYAKQMMMDYNRGINVHAQMNPVPFCTRPQMLVRLTQS